MILDDIRDELFKMQDIKYRDFNSKLIPTVDKRLFIGVRTPELRKYAKKLGKSIEVIEFLQALPHKYFDENQLHAFIISEIKDFKNCIDEINRFLPYIDNWATCDQLSPKVFKKHHSELFAYIKDWLKSDKVYTLRFGIGMLMEHFLDEDFDIIYPETVSKIRSDKYYVNMMIAWYFATALAKRYESIIPFIENCSLDTWTHNKAIQKALESYRISTEQKTYLRELKIKKV
ncbi:DNA alkylation repair protein [Lachnoanaerobaculum gingivalis]|uniref:DNA alkylation repair protein n=1 Tax=Lachnoanaerobaculum gingivalis TaxID=2490855 RepID=UPI0024A60E72|nr:DNA alkylation repair protein [Lachnoanaerobaculum gingivalis]WHE88486.1 DNA alkylation repair protein [Lachnoanaerobaculum gingivalis]